MHLLVKYPTRARPQQFLATLRGWIEAACDLKDITFLCNYDEDDETMNLTVVEAALAINPSAHVIMQHGVNASKIAAFNNHMAEVQEWDVVLALSDDMFCRRKDWDMEIRNRMTFHFPDTNGCLWFHDGTKQRVICTMSCVGRKYYELHGGYIYHPSYRSFFCDNEFSDVARMAGKLVFIEHGISSHEHPAWLGGMKPDALYRRNNIHWQSDKLNYERRKAAGFPP